MITFYSKFLKIVRKIKKDSKWQHCFQNSVLFYASGGTTRQRKEDSEKY